VNPQPDAPSLPSPAVAAAVRSQAVWALIAAIMMLYFGFYQISVIHDSFSARLLVYTLRYGGIAMAVSAALLATGRPFALAVDGVFSLAIGAALALSGILWIATVKTLSLDTILELVFGYLFFTAGLRSFREYRQLMRPTAPPADEPMATPDHASAQPYASTYAPPPAAPESHAPSRAQSPTPDTQSEPDDAPPPEGYLSSFADDEPRNNLK